MSGKIRNPTQRCKICGAECNKRMRYCVVCAREVKEIRARRKGVYFTPPAALDILGEQLSANYVFVNPPMQRGGATEPGACLAETPTPTTRRAPCLKSCPS